MRYYESANDNKDMSGFEEAASALHEYDILFGVVDCTIHMNVCRQSALQTLPSVKYFDSVPSTNPYTKRPYREGRTYTGKLTSKALKRLASRKMPDYVVKSSSSSSEKDSSSLPAASAIFVTSKDKITPMMKAVAIHFHDRLSIGHVNFNSNSRLGDVPRLVVLDSDHKIEAEFDIKADKSISNIKTFLETYASKEKQNKVNEDGVHVITALKEDVLEEEDATWVVAFTKGDEHVFREDLAKAASLASSAGLVRVGYVNCNKFTDQCSDDIKVPSVATYAFGKKKRRRFYGKNVDKALRNAIDTLPKSVVMGVEAMLDQYFVSAIQTEKIATFYLSNDVNVPAALRSFAHTFKDDLNVVAISSPSKMVLERFSMQKASLPKFLGVVVIPSSDENEPGNVNFQLVSFGGDTTDFSELLQFGTTLAKTILPQVYPDRERNNKEEEEVVVSKVEKYFGELTPENFKEACSKPCVVAFLEDTTNENAIKTFREVYEKKFKSMFDFYYVNGACQHEFAKSFDIETYMMPSVSLWARDKNKFVKMIGSYSADSIGSFLREVRRGKHVPASFKTEPSSSLVESCEVESVLEEDDIDLAELLADIKKEEEEQKKEVAKENVNVFEEDANPEWTDRLKELNKGKKRRRVKKKKKKKKKKKRKKKKSEL